MKLSRILSKEELERWRNVFERLKAEGKSFYYEIGVENDGK